MNCSFCSHFVTTNCIHYDTNLCVFLKRLLVYRFPNHKSLIRLNCSTFDSKDIFLYGFLLGIFLVRKRYYYVSLFNCVCVTTCQHACILKTWEYLTGFGSWSPNFLHSCLLACWSLCLSVSYPLLSRYNNPVKCTRQY